jgi:hypothetical protein
MLLASVLLLSFHDILISVNVVYSVVSDVPNVVGNLAPAGVPDVPFFS